MSVIEVRVSGMKSTKVWLRRTVARLPFTLPKAMFPEFGRKIVGLAKMYAQMDAIYHGNPKGALTQSIKWYWRGKNQIVIGSNHPGAMAAEEGMKNHKGGKKRVYVGGGKWITVKGRGYVMTKSRGLHFMGNAVADIVREMDGIVLRNLNKTLGR